MSFEVLSGVETIGKKAFYRCENLTKIVLPDGLNSIGESAFAECDALTSVEIGTDLSEIASHAFADCGNLKSVTIAPTETGIALGEYAFSGCKISFGWNRKITSSRSATVLFRERDLRTLR